MEHINIQMREEALADDARIAADFDQVLGDWEAEAFKADTVNHPEHYTQGGIECIDVLEQLAKDGHDFRILNAMKYLWRYRHKGGDESLMKALWYIERVLNDG